MNDFETVLMLKKIDSQKYGRGLLEDIRKIEALYSPHRLTDTVVQNLYTCLTRAMSRYIVKCVSPLPQYTYRIKSGMEQKILTGLTIECTYEKFSNIFKYVKDIPADVPNSDFSVPDQVTCPHNYNHTMLAKLAQIVGSNEIPFTIWYNTTILNHHRTVSEDHTICEVILLQEIKQSLNPHIHYTLIEQELRKHINRDNYQKTVIEISKPLNKLNTTIKAINTLRSIVWH